MAYEFSNYSVRATLKAGADLSTTGQNLFVKLQSDGTIIAVAAATDRPIGVLTNNPKSGQEGSVVLVGGVKLTAGGTVAVGDPITTDATGKAVKITVGTDTTKYILGTAITGGASGEIITVAIATPTASRGA
jgi:Uncharacterized conserved protein (DUF2190)